MAVVFDRLFEVDKSLASGEQASNCGIMETSRAKLNTTNTAKARKFRKTKGIVWKFC